MDNEQETSRMIRALVEKHLESVVSIRAFKKPVQEQLGGGGQQDRGKQRMGEEEEEEEKKKKKEKEKEKEKEEEPRTPVCYGTGSIIFSCDSLAIVLSVAHTFHPFRPAGGYRPVGVPQVNEGTMNLVEFFDGHVWDGHIMAIGWYHDVSIIMVLTAKRYRAVKFFDHTCSAIGFSAHEREARIYSICTYPAEQENALFGTALSGKICGPPRRGRDIDSAFYPELRMCEFSMDGASGCSGAPLFTATRHVMGMWISQVGEFKFAVLVESICEWLRTIYKIQETGMKHVVIRLAAIYSVNLGLVDPHE